MDTGREVKTARSCHCAETAGAVQRPRWISRFGGAAGFVLPGFVLAVIPKCPMCFAAYVGLWTGLGLSVTAATQLRITLIAACVAALFALTALHLYRALSKKRGAPFGLDR